MGISSVPIAILILHVTSFFQVCVIPAHPSFKIRRIVLPFSSTATTTPAPLASVRALNECSHTIVSLFRPRERLPLSIPFEFEARECPVLLSLKRLEWWHCSNAPNTGLLKLSEHRFAQTLRTQVASTRFPRSYNTLQILSTYLLGQFEV